MSDTSNETVEETGTNVVSLNDPSVRELKNDIIKTRLRYESMILDLSDRTGVPATNIEQGLLKALTLAALIGIRVNDIYQTDNSEENAK